MSSTSSSLNSSTREIANIKFVGVIRDANVLLTMLKILHAEVHVCISFSQNGLKLSWDNNSRTYQATSCVDSKLFEKYHFDSDVPEHVFFRSKPIIDSLKMFVRDYSEENPTTQIQEPKGNEVKMKIVYDNEKLAFEIREGGHKPKLFKIF